MWAEGSMQRENNKGPKIDPWGTPCNKVPKNKIKKKL